ncbi:MAG: DUF4476 domain-containing protein [Bacteroidales bacterium]|jgi:hypothetical protein|nr:DUF4476 domain-containing protein [Bacteroidales bacterium]
MKKLFLFLFLSIICLTSFAQYGSITVSSNSNQKFWLFIDDVLQNEFSTNIIKIQGLQYIYYKVRVELDNPFNNCVGQTVMISNIPNGNNYVVSKDRSNNFKFEKTQSAVNPFFIQSIIVPDYSCFSGYNQYLFPGFNPNTSYGQGNQHKGNAYKRDQNNSQVYGNHGYTNSSSYGNPSGHSNQSDYNYGSGYGAGMGAGCMSQNDFSRALSILQKESFENSKMEIAKQISSTNILCVLQIIQICKLFSFENSKLEFAKFAYSNCFDRNNYFQVNEVFSYSTSKDELRNYINIR